MKDIKRGCDGLRLFTFVSVLVALATGGCGPTDQELTEAATAGRDVLAAPLRPVEGPGSSTDTTSSHPRGIEVLSYLGSCGPYTGRPMCSAWCVRDRGKATEWDATGRGQLIGGEGSPTIWTIPTIDDNGRTQPDNVIIKTGKSCQ